MEGKTRGLGVVVEHLHGLQGVLGEVFTNEGEFLEDVVGGGDDVAADCVGLENVQQLAGAGPDQLGVGGLGEYFHGGSHDWDGIAAGVGNASGEDRESRRRG